MNGHNLFMPFKPHGQEEWLDTSDEEDFDDEDLMGSEDDSDEDIDEKDSEDLSTESFNHMRKRNTYTGTCRQSLEASLLPGRSSTLPINKKELTATNLSAKNGESKASTSTGTFHSVPIMSPETMQRTCSVFSSGYGLSAQEQHHVAPLASRSIRRFKRATSLINSPKDTSTEPTTLKPKLVTTTVPVTSPTESKLNGEKSGKEEA